MRRGAPGLWAVVIAGCWLSSAGAGADATRQVCEAGCRKKHPDNGLLVTKAVRAVCVLQCAKSKVGDDRHRKLREEDRARGEDRDRARAKKATGAPKAGAEREVTLCRDKCAEGRSPTDAQGRAGCFAKCPRLRQPSREGCRQKCAAMKPHERQGTLDYCIQSCMADAPEPIRDGY